MVNATVEIPYQSDTGPACCECRRMIQEQHDAIERLRVQVELIRQAWVHLSQQLAAIIQHCGSTSTLARTSECGQQADGG